MATDGARRRFVLEHTALAAPPLVPEIELHLAAEVDPLWHATQAWLDDHDLPPPFWAFAWPGGIALARLILDGVIDVCGRSVVDLASGSGLVAIAAARAGAARVRAVDLDPFATAATIENAARSGVVVDALTADAASAPDADITLAGDVFYDAMIAECMISTLAARAARGSLVYAGDPQRTYAPAGWTVARAIEVPTSLELEGTPSKTTRVLTPPPGRAPLAP